MLIEFFLIPKIMKASILNLLLFLFLPLIAICQNPYSISPESFDQAFNEDLNTVTYLRFEGLMENTADTAISINWDIVDIDLPIEWGLSVSDKDMSYPPGPQITTSNGNPIIFDANESEIPFNVDVYPKETPGCGEFNVIITLAQTGFVLDTIEYRVSINDDDCSITSIGEQAFNEAIELFPNPFVNYLRINTSAKIESTKIYNSNGITILRALNNSNTLNLSKLEAGLYYLEIVFANGRRTVKKILKEK